MDLEELTLRYYLKLFSSIFIAFFIAFFIFIFFYKISLDENYIKIKKGQSVNEINKSILVKGKINKHILESILKISNQIYSPINYGTFYVKNGSSIMDIINILSNKSNIDYKITIIGGWEKYNLNQYLTEYYNVDTNINYEVVGCGVMIFLMLGGLIWRRKKGKGVKATN